MVSSSDPDGYEADSLELITGAGTDEPEGPGASTDEPGSGLGRRSGTGPERHTLILGDPAPHQAAGTDDSTAASLLPHEDLYRGDGDEIDLIDGVDPAPVYQPGLIDSEDGAMMVVDPPAGDAGPDVVEVEDTLMAGDDYGDVP